MCDCNNNSNKKGGERQGPPEVLPSWMTCPPSLQEKNYPVPQGVDILPISVGGRNGSPNKKKFKCGQCGQDKPPANTKPKAAADCPMMKGRCDGMVGDSSKSGGIMDKIKAFFGIGKDPRLVELCEKLHLQVPDDQITHHRDVFNPQLFVRKDGYMSPFMTKVDCEEACKCNNEDELDEDCEDEDDLDEFDEECVEDGEGECILEESAECMDENCALYLDAKPGETGQEDCKAMNNFIIRVQAPFSMSSTNETCEQIIARLVGKAKQYPEPGPKPEKKQGEVELVVKQISVEEPSCDCPPPKKKCKKKPAKAKAEAAQDCPPDTPPPPPPTDACKDENLAAATQPVECPQPEGIPCPPEDESKKEGEKRRPPVRSDQNDCETLSEAELLKKALKDIKCGCGKPCPEEPEGPYPGLTCFGGDGTSVWTPPPPPPCPRCGAAVRGDTDGCYLCHITRRMRSGIPEATDSLPQEFKDAMQIEDKSDSCTPEYLPDGSLKYKGGACINLTNTFLRLIEKRRPAGGFYDQFAGKCGDADPPQTIKACPENIDKPKYSGGMGLKACADFLLGRFSEESPPPPKRICKQKEKPSGDKCPPPTK